jgi:hypothetical protein
MNDWLKTIAVTFLVLVVVVSILMIWDSFSGGRTSSHPRTSWSWPAIPTWAWWVVAGIVCLSALYFLVPWFMGLVGASGGATSTIWGWFETNFGIMIVVAVTIGLVVLRFRGYTGGGMVMVGIAFLSAFIGFWFLIGGERAALVLAQQRAKAVSALLDDTDNSEEVGLPMAKIEWPHSAYNVDWTIRPNEWSKVFWLRPHCRIEYHNDMYGSVYVTRHLVQNGQRREWVDHKYGELVKNGQAVQFKMLEGGYRELKIYHRCSNG